MTIELVYQRYCHGTKVSSKN